MKYEKIMTKIGLLEKTMAARPALAMLTPIWKRIMLKQMLTSPRTAKYPQSERLRWMLRFFTSRTASGMSNSPPTRNRRKVSWKGVNAVPAIFKEISIVPKAMAVRTIHNVPNLDDIQKGPFLSGS